MLSSNNRCYKTQIKKSKLKKKVKNWKKLNNNNKKITLSHNQVKEN